MFEELLQYKYQSVLLRAVTAGEWDVLLRTGSSELACVYVLRISGL